MRINILKALRLDQISEMIYMNNNGEISKQRVKVLSVEGNTFKAFCFLRNTRRTFKVNNVLAFVPFTQKEREVI